MNKINEYLYEYILPLFVIILSIFCIIITILLTKEIIEQNNQKNKYDLNNDGVVNITDLVELRNYIANN